MLIVGKAVHEHKGRPRTLVVTGVEFSLFAGNSMLGESRFAVHDILAEGASDVGPPRLVGLRMSQAEMV
jgi:hypothetical protein